jgi:hypothetical protein
MIGLHLQSIRNEDDLTLQSCAPKSRRIPAAYSCFLYERSGTTPTDHRDVAADAQLAGVVYQLTRRV